MDTANMTRDQLIAALTASREAHADTLGKLGTLLAAVGPVVDQWAYAPRQRDGNGITRPRGPAEIDPGAMYHLAAAVRDARPIYRG